MSDNIRKKWDQRFTNKKPIAPTPPPFTGFMQPFLKPGSLLDIACGDGALSLYFAQNGWQVTGLDISAVALDRMKSFANDANLKLHTLCCDLSELSCHNQAGLTEQPTQYNNIVIGRYKPDIEQWQSIISLLQDGGILCISTFNELQHLEHNFSKRFCLEENELRMLKGLKLIQYQRSVYNGDHFDNYCFQKQPTQSIVTP